MESVKVMMSDPAIREFLAMLEGNAAGEAGFRSLMGHIGQIEGRLFEGARESAALRAEIAAMREDMRHPVRIALTEAADRLDRALAERRLLPPSGRKGYPRWAARWAFSA